MGSFAEHLTRQLHAYQDETYWLSVDTVRQMLARAAQEAVDRPAQVRLWREVNPEDMAVVIRVEIEGESFTLWPEEVATLRALLLGLDETAPARLGEPLSMPCKLEDGRVVSLVTEELL